MYQVYFDQYPLHDLRDDDLVLREPDVHLAVGESGSMSFTLDPDHPYADRLTRLHGKVKLLADGRQIFAGRICKDTRDFNLFRRIEVEGLLSCLNDSIIPPFDFPAEFLERADYKAAAAGGNVVAYFLGWVLGLHNSQVGPEQQIQLGTVTVSDPNNYISRASSSYLTTMEVVRKKLEDLLGGYLVADYSGETPVLHYYDELPLTNVQEVRYGENLLDLVSEIDAAKICTALLPTGSEGLTLAGLPDGDLGEGIWKEGLIVYSKPLEEELGGARITHIVKMDDVTLATNLRSKAADHLASQGARALHTLEIRAADLGSIEDLPRFVVGRNVHLYSERHGFEATFPLMVLDPDIENPANTEITLGAAIKAASDISHAQQNATQEQLDEQRLEFNKQWLNTSEAVGAVRTSLTEAIQDSEKIMLKAMENYVETSAFSEYQQQVSSEFEQVPGQINLKFSEAEEHIRDVDGDLQLVKQQQQKHFEFTADGLTIKAGDQSGAMQLKLDNNIIRFVQDGRQFGWWDGTNFHTGNIYIDVLERAQFNTFAAIPRRKGNLSWLKVK